MVRPKELKVRTLNIEHRTSKNKFSRSLLSLNGLAIVAIALVTPLLLAAGCITKSKAKLEEQKAFLAGQQQAMMRMSQPQQPVVTFIGPVRNPVVIWSQDMTLAKAIVAAGYEAKTDPNQIMIVRNGQAIPVDPKKLLAGEDIPLVAGDLVQMGQ